MKEQGKNTADLTNEEENKKERKSAVYLKKNSE